MLLLGFSRIKTKKPAFCTNCQLLYFILIITIFSLQSLPSTEPFSAAVWELTQSEPSSSLNQASTVFSDEIAHEVRASLGGRGCCFCLLSREIAAQMPGT